MILQGDCFELIKEQPDNSVDLIVTSPPYADIVNYGKNVSIQKPQDYCDWLLPLFNEIHRVLKPSGSFILNINDNCSKGLRNPFVYELIYRSQKETNLKFYDTYIWHKRNGIPNGTPKRFRNMTEFMFHFVKNPKEMKFYMERVLEEPAEETKNRSKYDWEITTHGKIKDGERVKEGKRVRYYTGSANTSKEGYNKPTTYRILPTMVRPDNVFRFPTAAKSRDNHIKHPAPFNKELPKYFINLLTDEGDLVIDVFGGIGTTNIAAKELNRQHISYELNPKYVEFGNNRIEGKELEKYMVCAYDLNDNLVGCWDNREQASRATGVESGDIMRTYNRTKFETRGGYKWKLEKQV